MRTSEVSTIAVSAKVNAPVEKVWQLWTDPKHIVHWNYASDDWHTPRADNDLHPGGKFLLRMEAKDGSAGFDFTGVYGRIEEFKLIEYTIADGRKVLITFLPDGKSTTITETFEAEHSHTLEMQQAGWQATLDNFKQYAEYTTRLHRLHFEVEIDAGVEKVFQTMLDENSYREWTSEFNPTSHFRGSWIAGSKMLFLGTDQNGNLGGMVSKIKEIIPNRFVSIEHRGIIQEGKEVMKGPEVDKWAGGLENYSFSEKDGRTLLSVDLDTIRDFRSYFEETWPKALNKLKALCE